MFDECYENIGRCADDTTLIRFRNRLDENDLYDKLMSKLEKQLTRSGLKITEGRNLS